MAEGLGCALQYVPWDRLCPSLGSLWPFPSEAPPASPPPAVSIWAPAPTTRILLKQFSPSAGTFSCMLPLIWNWAGIFFWNKERYTTDCSFFPFPPQKMKKSHIHKKKFTAWHNPAVHYATHLFSSHSSIHPQVNLSLCLCGVF